MKIETWPRSQDGELIPIHKDMKLYRNIYTDVIKKYDLICQAFEQKENMSDKDKEEYEVSKKVIIEIRKERETKSEIMKLKFLPILNFEIERVGQKIEGKLIGLSGDIIDDQYADICAHKCVEPKYTYDEWRDMKNKDVPKIIANEIYESSLPVPTEEEKADAEALRKKVKSTVMSI